MEQRTIERFRKRAILLHWLFATSLVVLLATGSIMFFDLTSMAGGQQIRLIHRITAAFFIGMPVLYAIFDPRSALSFLKETFHWVGDDLAWLRKSLKFYFGGEVEMPPQGYINGDQRLWQLTVVIAGLIFMITGIMMWFFKLSMPFEVYQAILLMHAAVFVIVLFMAPLHFYLTTLYPGYDESLSSMLDGKVSSAYAIKHYRKWYEDKAAGEKS